MLISKSVEFSCKSLITIWITRWKRKKGDDSGVTVNEGAVENFIVKDYNLTNSFVRELSIDRRWVDFFREGEDMNFKWDFSIIVLTIIEVPKEGMKLNVLNFESLGSVPS